MLQRARARWSHLPMMAMPFSSNCDASEAKMHGTTLNGDKTFKKHTG